MRQSLTDTFDEMYLLDLHGNAKKKEQTPKGGKDENVFDIQQGVAVCLFVKRADGSDDPARVFHADLWGEREAGPEDGKYGWLAANDVETTQWAELTPKSPRYLFIPRDETLAEEYEAGWGIADVFPTNSVGIVTARDKLTIQWTRDDMDQVASTLAELSEDDARTRYDLRKDSQDWKVRWAQADIRSHPDIDAHITPVLYRLFDRRWTFYTGQPRGLICRPRSNVMRHMSAGPNLGLITSRQQSQVGIAWSLCGVSRDITESSAISNKTSEINYLFPLYTYPTEEQEQVGQVREPNLSKEFVEALSSALALEFVPDGPGDLRQSFGPEDVLHYIYAVLHSPEYRRRYADFLKSDFARVQITGDRSLFSALVDLGKRLTSLHLMESEGGAEPSFPLTGDNRVDKERYRPPVNGSQGRVYINRDQYFDGVTPETWEFTIGGYRPAEKWLKDRRRRTLSYEDITHYRRICAVLVETPRVMARVDDAIDAHGGWPLG